MIPSDDIFQLLLSNFGFAFCHQIPGRSFIEGGLQLPVCSRDTGTAIGFLVAFGIFHLTNRYSRKRFPDKIVILFVIISYVIFTFDVGSSYLGLRPTTNSIRLFSGLVFGASVGILILFSSSIFVYGAREETRAFTWKDIILIIAILITVYFFISENDLGITGYYSLSIAIVLSYSIIMFSAIRLLLTLYLDWQPAGIKYYQIALVLAFQLVLMLGLWFMHFIANGGLEYHAM